MKGHFLIILFFFNSLATYSQPQGINYQGVARDSIGHPVLNQNISLKLSILDGSETGVVVYSEIHSVLTSTSGLFNISIGMGNTVSGLFANVSWGKGNKWLKIEMDAIGGSNYQLIGNMQFMSVPYAIQSQNTTNIFANVSSFGDTLFIGNTSIKIPGISNYNRGACSPGESTATDIDGNIYDVISIGSQCWLKQNLKVTHFNNNVAITNIISNSAWQVTSQPAWCYYNNDFIYNADYGILYNAFAITDTNELCPIGWHVPDDVEWGILSNAIGGINNAGAKLKEAGLTHWLPPNTGADNSTNFTFMPGAYRATAGNFGGLGNFGILWSTSTWPNTTGVNSYYQMSNSSTLLYNNVENKNTGFSVRCIKD